MIKILILAIIAAALSACTTTSLKPPTQLREPVGLECPNNDDWPECVIEACLKANPTDSGVEYCLGQEY